MIAYKFNNKTKEYIGTQSCQLDPLESEKAGRCIYLLPADCTFTAPEFKEGFVSIFNGTTWELVKDHRGKFYYPKDAQWNSSPIEMNELGEFPEGSTLDPPEKPELVVINEHISELKTKLIETDYIIIKIAEGEATREEYVDIISNRRGWREEIRVLQSIVESDN